MDLRWHYTVRTRPYLGRILEEGVIRREGETGRPIKHIAGMVPCVWFSTNQVYEPTAVKVMSRDGERMTLDEMISVSKAIAARIGVLPDVAPVTWENWKLRCRGNQVLTKRQREYLRETIAGMEKDFKENGANPADWFASLDPVPRSQWQRVEIFMDGEWREADEANIPWD